SELSQEMGVKSSELIKKLMNLGLMATANQSIDTDTATLIATDYGYEVQHTAFKEEEVLKTPPKEESKEGWRPRAPVVTVMGHVDHGKTSILDKIRKTKVAEGEAGGITQHIGAYEVHLEKGNITFIDTPGHQAFTRMRARGARVTDIVVLVVAADDGIMPQTVEAIDHAKAAGVPIVVAINKIDKPQADSEKVKRGLSEHGLVSEDWGGDVICVQTSAKSGQGLDQLLEMILLTAQMQELKAPFEGPGHGVLIETRMEKGRGAEATLLVQRGIVSVGDYVVAGLHYGKVRAMTAAGGGAVAKAHPSQAVGLLGLQGVPEAGDELFVVADEKDAKQIAQERQAKQRKAGLATTAKLSLEALQEQISKGEVHELPLVIKADVAGSKEALAEALNKLSTEKVSVKIIHSGTGGITESDVTLAQASKAVIVGFNVVPEGKARALAEQEGIDIRFHSIIYEVLDDIQKAMTGLLKPAIREKFLGRAEIKQVFKVSKVGNIAGCQVSDGTIRRNAPVRLVRDGAIVYEGKISSLKRFKDDAREATTGMECGIGIEKFNDIKEGDVIECFVKEEVAQTL
ncbi:MAG: translation initiation factor IF-2, partial [Deltaproteobacteria bacterium]|nr:translation initiation factor IF-2 [Deltaproteobacteria bacterium]